MYLGSSVSLGSLKCRTRSRQCIGGYFAEFEEVYFGKHDSETQGVLGLYRSWLGFSLSDVGPSAQRYSRH
jgi:hypothetical protein